MLSFEKQISRLESRLSINNDISTATNLALRYWQASRFMLSETDARVLMQRANHTALTAHRRNAAHGDMYALAVFIAIEAGHYESAGEMLEKAMGYKSFLRANAPHQYALLCFLYAYLEIIHEQTRSAKKYWRMFSDYTEGAADTDYTIMHGLLYLANGDFENAFIYLRDAFLNGSNSIFLYEGLFRYYRTTPHKPQSGIILTVLIYAASRGVDITNIALRHQNALFAAAYSSPETCEHLFIISGHLPLLQIICEHRIANNDVSYTAYLYYKQAEEKHIFAEGLFDVIVHAAYANNLNYISRHALARFLEANENKQANSTAEQLFAALYDSYSPYKQEPAVYFYNLMLTTPGMEDLLPGQHSRIMRLAEDCLEKGLAENSLYYYYWKNNGENLKAAEEFLHNNLTKFIITLSPNSNVRHIYITEPEKRGMTAYDLPEGKNSLIIDATDKNFSCTCLGAGKRTIINVKITVKRVLLNVKADLYEHFFNSGYRHFHLLTFLANHYITRQEVSNNAATVFETILAEKAITKAYRTRVLLALGQIYYCNSSFDKALECYNEVNSHTVGFAEQVLAQITEQILNIYLQTNETERAVKLIQKKHHCIPGEFLQGAIGSLLSKPTNHPLLAEASYELLINGFYSKQLLDLVLANYSGSYGEWTTLAHELFSIDVASLELDTLILETALWMAVWDADAQDAFVRVCEYDNTKTEDIITRFIEYATYELLANNARPEYNALSILEERCLNQPENILLTWAVASCYLHHNITTLKTEKILAAAIDTMEKENVLFPVFKISRFARIPFIEKHQPFLYRGLPGKDYRLNYRVPSNEGEFTSAPMKYIKYGLYNYCVPVFYNEVITYYYSEELATGSIATKEEYIKNTTPFLYEHPTDQFFAINNAIIYEQMFKHDQVEKTLNKLVKDVQTVKSKLL